MKFTDKMISNLKPKEKHYVIREGDGFAIRVQPTNHKIWLFIYTIIGKRRWMNLGDYPDISLAMARDRLTDARKALKDGRDPQDVGFEWHRDPERERRVAAQNAEDELKNPTVKELAKSYMELHAKRKKRESCWKEDERLLNKDVLPVWGERKASDITRRDVKDLLESVVVRGPALAANIKKLVSKMFSFAVDEEILESSPCIKIALPAPVPKRDRVLSPKEIHALLTKELPKASMSSEVKRMLQLILVTVQRPGEVAGMHRREIDGKWWTIPGERTKNGRTHRVYLTDLALELIGDREGYIFPTPVGEGVTHIDENALAYAIRRNMKNYQPRRPIKGDSIKMVAVKEEKKMDMEHFTPHDLRRTANTLMASMKVAHEHRERVMNHAQEKLDGIYNLHDYDDEKRQALLVLEQKIKNIRAGIFHDDLQSQDE